MLERFTVAHLALPTGEISQIIERVADAAMETRQMIPSYIAAPPGSRDLGESMMDIWEEGVKAFSPEKTRTLLVDTGPGGIAPER